MKRNPKWAIMMDEIPFTRYFYKYQAPQPSAEIMAEILELEKELEGSLQEVFDI